MKLITKALLVATLAVASCPWSAWAGTLTCSVVARRGDLDPDGFLFSNRFRDDVGVNAGGDTLFVARPSGTRDRLYLYGAIDEVIAEGNLAAPGGSTFTAKPFSHISINDAGDLAFRGKLVSQGLGVFVREAGGSPALAAQITQAAPGGGTFEDFPDVGLVTSSGVVPFVADVLGGTGGVYTHTISTSTNAAALLDGTAVTSPAGRFLCDILQAEMGDGGDLAVLASTKVNCADGLESPVDGVYHESGGTVTEVALIGNAGPIGGTTFNSFTGGPSVSSTGEVAFLAKLTGSISVRGVFSWTGVVTAEVLQGDFEPDTAGSYKKFRSVQALNTGAVVANSLFKGTSDNEAIMELDGSPVALLEVSDAPPFGVAYRRFGDMTGVSHGGTNVAIKVKFLDSVSPKTKAGVVTCS